MIRVGRRSDELIPADLATTNPLPGMAAATGRSGGTLRGFRHTPINRRRMVPGSKPGLRGAVRSRTSCGPDDMKAPDAGVDFALEAALGTCST